MSSRINQLSDLYSRLSLSLPEELFDADLEEKLDSSKSTLDTIFREDHDTLQELVRSKNEQKYISLGKIEKGNYLLTKGLPPIDESKSQDKRELVIYLLSHWFMSVYALKMIFREIIDELRTTKEQHNIYTSKTDITNYKRAAFLRFTISYQAVTGYAISAGELMEEYDYYLSHACHELDESFPLSRTTLRSRIRPSKLLRAAIELELRGNYGGHTCPPVLRSAVEVALTRRVLDTTGTKHAQMIVKPTADLKIGSLANAAEKIGLTLPYSLDAISTLYDWGSQSIHTAERMPTCEIWAAWIAANNISSIKVPRMKPKKRERERDIKERERIIKERETIIDRFVQQRKVMLIDKSTLHVMSL
jgi:hypothetical protein